jgi:hypothetical protein
MVTRTPIVMLLALAASARAQCTPGWSAVGPGAAADVLSVHAPDAPATDPVDHGYVGTSNGPWVVPGQSWWRPAGWDGWTWSPMGSGLTVTGDDIKAVRHWPAGVPGSAQPGLYIGGYLTNVGGVPVTNVARWDGASWHEVGAGVSSPEVYPWIGAFKEYDEDGPGPAAPVLYAGGRFTRAGVLPANGFARWDGTQWSAPPQQLATASPATWPSVYALEVYDDDGPGPRRPGLYAGGSFRYAGALLATNIARWDGQAWEAVGFQGVNSTVDSLCVFDDDGPGPRPPALFVGGQFNWAGGATAIRMARWDGQSWSGVTAFNSSVRAMAVFDDDGPGPNPPALFATGFFTYVGATPVNCITKWNGVGSSWQPLGSGLAGGVGVTYGLALTVFDEDGDGPGTGGLYVGGHFTSAGGVPGTTSIARWGCPVPPRCYPDCNADGILNLADFGCFQTRFATGQPYADCNGDGVLNLADFGCFQTRFALGCP